MNMKMLIIGAIVAVVLIAGAFVFLVLPEDDAGADETVNFNGQTYDYEEMLNTLGNRTVDGDTGVPLDAIIEDGALANPETYTYVLTADDGYAMAVNWSQMKKGIVTLVEEENDDGEMESYLMTSFPDLPGGFKVRYLTDIEHRELDGIELANIEYFLDYMPKKVSEKTIQHNETTNFTGYGLGDMVNYTDIENPENYDYVLIASDGYSKTVNWDTMMSGIIVEEDTMSYFPGLAKSYWVKDIVEIDSE